jgi:DNA-binding NarL/FixJ family response regulator
MISLSQFGAMTEEPRDHAPYGVLVVDDHDAFRQIARAVVDATAQLQVVGEAASGEAGIDVASELRPDLVLMDVRMPGIGGVEAARRVRAILPECVIVLISVDGAEAVSAPLHACGADATLSKQALTPAILATLWRRHRRPPAPAEGSESH